jgi:nicotinamide-nucleotide amidase
MTTAPPASDPDLPSRVEATAVASGRRSVAEQLVDRLTEIGWTVGVAESLTGGLVIASLVSVPGASAVVRGGIVAYATDLKQSLLGVDPVLLEAHGPVHERVAQQMARGVRNATGSSGRPADVGIATTGIAGPGSPDGQPVGTVHIGVCTPLGSRVESLHLSGGRDEIRAAAAARALSLAIEVL